MRKHSHLMGVGMMLFVGALGLLSQSGMAATVVFSPTDDTTINQAESPNTVFGDASSILMRNKNAGEIDSLIQFDLFSLPSIATIESAKLKLYLYNWSGGTAAGRSVSLYQITSSWKEETVRWNTQPSYASTPTSSSLVPSSIGQWMTWDVTDDVQTIIRERVNFGWKITDEYSEAQAPLPTVSFRTKEYGNYIPYLEVSYTVSESTQAPLALFSITPSNPAVDDTVQFTDHSVDADSTIVAWYWGFGDGNSSTSRNPTHSYDQDGQYSVTLKVTDNTGQTAAMTTSLVIAGQKSTSGFELIITLGAIAAVLLVSRKWKKLK